MILKKANQTISLFLLVLLRLHFFNIVLRFNVRYSWFIQECLFLLLLVCYLLVGLFYLRAGLISSIHNFVLDFSSSWIFFFFSNIFFLFVIGFLYWVFTTGTVHFRILNVTFFSFLTQYLFFNLLIFNGFSAFFFNYFLFQALFGFLNIGAVFTFSCFFFFLNGG